MSILKAGAWSSSRWHLLRSSLPVHGDLCSVLQGLYLGHRCAGHQYSGYWLLLNVMRAVSTIANVYPEVCYRNDNEIGVHVDDIMTKALSNAQNPFRDLRTIFQWQQTGRQSRPFGAASSPQILVWQALWIEWVHKEHPHFSKLGDTSGLHPVWDVESPIKQWLKCVLDSPHPTWGPEPAVHGWVPHIQHLRLLLSFSSAALFLGIERFPFHSSSSNHICLLRGQRGLPSQGQTGAQKSLSGPFENGFPGGQPKQLPLFFQTRPQSIG